MKKASIILITVLSMLIINSCSSVREGFTSQKKNSTDEFLVKKKSPLVMPPDFDELPTPETGNQQSDDSENLEIKSLITNTENSSTQKENPGKNTSFENSILKKIKDN
tara:strand:- start:383 stop:706 length:324 start_codon:yes stop_codon:yes gene_type:complete